MPRIIDPLNLTLSLKNELKALCFLGFRQGIDHRQGWRIGSARVFKTEDAIVLNLLQQVHRLNEVVGGFAWKSDDDIGRERNLSFSGPDPADALQVPFSCVFPGHHFEYARGTRLDREMHMIAKSWKCVDRVDDIPGEVARMAGGEANAADARNLPTGRPKSAEGQLFF